MACFETEIITENGNVNNEPNCFMGASFCYLLHIAPLLTFDFDIIYIIHMCRQIFTFFFRYTRPCPLYNSHKA